METGGIKRVYLLQLCRRTFYMVDDLHVRPHQHVSGSQITELSSMCDTHNVSCVKLTASLNYQSATLAYWTDTGGPEMDLYFGRLSEPPIVELVNCIMNVVNDKRNGVLTLSGGFSTSRAWDNKNTRSAITRPKILKWEYVPESVR
jgi:hypothetical protein